MLAARLCKQLSRGLIAIQHTQQGSSSACLCVCLCVLDVGRAVWTEITQSVRYIILHPVFCHRYREMHSFVPIDSVICKYAVINEARESLGEALIERYRQGWDRNKRIRYNVKAERLFFVNTNSHVKCTAFSIPACLLRWHSQSCSTGPDRALSLFFSRLGLEGLWPGLGHWSRQML